MPLDTEQVAGTAGESAAAAAPGAASAVPEAAGGESGGPVAPAASESTKQEPAPKSSLEAVKAVMDRDRKAAEEKAKPAAEQQQPAAEAQKQPEAKEGEQQPDPNDDPKTWSPNAQRRFRELTGEKRRLEAAIQQYEPDAKAMAQLRGWVQQNGLDMQTAVAALETFALARVNPAEAWKRLEPIVQQVRGALGEELPKDLADDVESGVLSAERAKELARLRADTQRTQALTAEQMQRMNEERAQREAEATVEGIRSSVAAYEAEWQRQDPDFARKHPWVRNEVLALMQIEGMPPNQQAAVEQVKRARKNVEDRLKQTMPQPPKREVNTVVNTGSGSAAVGTPRNSLEAAKMAAAGEQPRYAAA